MFYIYSTKYSNSNVEKKISILQKIRKKIRNLKNSPVAIEQKLNLELPNFFKEFCRDYARAIISTKTYTGNHISEELPFPYQITDKMK